MHLPGSQFLDVCGLDVLDSLSISLLELCPCAKSCSLRCAVGSKAGRLARSPDLSLAAMSLYEGGFPPSPELIERLTGTVLSSSLQFDEVSGQCSSVRAGIRQTRVLEFRRARVCFLVGELNFSSLNSCIFILND